MANLEQLFAKARAEVDQAVGTAGTTVRFADVTKAMGNDLAKTETVANPRTVQAIVTVVGGGNAQITPDLEIHATDWRVLMKADETLPEIGQDVRIETCLDPRLLGRRGHVLGSVLDSSGAYTSTFVRPRPQTKA